MPQATMIAVPRRYTGRRPILSVSAPQKVVATMPSAAAIIVAVRRDRPVGQLLAGEVGQHEGDRHRVAGGLGDAQAERAQDVAPVVAQHLDAAGSSRARPLP